jgi:ribonucleoside-diphosphate reductase alpha chain
MNFSPNALKVLQHRYLHGGETPQDMIERVAHTMSNIPEYYESEKKITETKNRFFKLLNDNKFWPNTPCLINAGKPLGQLAACFVLPIEDSIEGIFDAMKQAAIIQKTGGGTGFSFSKLRPANFPVDTTQGTASGPISFMRVFNSATNEMKQGGVRRGANMAVLRVDHPDIEEFIMCKDSEGEFSNFNISVGITSDFMIALRKNANYDLMWNNETIKSIKASKIARMIAEQNWKNGEPGIVFLDRINALNPLKEIETIEGTNPCGEQPLPPFGICNLGSINLSSHVSSWNQSESKPKIDYTTLRETVYSSVEFLDNMINVNKYPLPQLEKEALSKRRIGLGIMGLADMFLKMEVRYGSEESFDLADQVMKFIDETAVEASIELGKIRSVPNMLLTLSPILHRTLRNGVITTIAPTGSISILADCSSGCEPIFAFDFDKSCIDTEIQMKHWFVEYWEKENPGKSLPSYAVEAGDVTPEEHIKMQGILQRHIGASISKTINCNNETTVEDIEKLMMLSWEEGCKSFTTYRDGSRKFQALTKKKTEVTTTDYKELKNVLQSDEVQQRVSEIIKDTPNETGIEKSRPKILDGKTIKIKTGRGKLYVTVNEFEGKPFEVFLKIGKSGREDFAYSEAIGRLISLGLRARIPVEMMVRHLEGISGADQVFDYGRLIKSVPDAVAFFLREYYMENKHEQVGEQVNHTIICPDCECVVILESGCLTCHNCGWSKC